MKRLIPFALVLAATACGSTGTDSSGTGDDDDDGSTGAFTCASFQAGPGIICDTSTTPPTIRVDFGSGAGQAVPGDDPRLAAIDPNKGKFIASFTPAATEAINGMLIKNAATGKIGIRAADELCKLKNAAFPNAHMCTNEEVLWNVRNGFIANGAQGLALGMDYPDPGIGTAEFAASSAHGSCNGLTYNSADEQHTGSRWVATFADSKNESPANDETNAVLVTVETGLPCSTVLPIACCQ